MSASESSAGGEFENMEPPGYGAGLELLAEGAALAGTDANEGIASASDAGAFFFCGGVGILAAVQRSAFALRKKIKGHKALPGRRHCSALQ